MMIPTHNWHRTKGAVFEDYFGCEIPSHYGNPTEEYWALRSDVAIRDVSFFAKVKISGKDAQLFLHRMVTSDIKALTTGNGVWSLFLDIKGHIQGDFKLYAFPDHLLMVLQHYVKDKVVQGLDRYVIGEKVKWEDVSEQLAMFQVLGPKAEEFLKTKSAELPQNNLSFITTSIAGAEIQIIRLGAGYALLCPMAEAEKVLNDLNLRPIGMRAFEIFRIENGLPLLQKDVEENNFPQEGRMEGALNFQKGCYLGQEVMARIDAQGHVNKFLMGIQSTAPLAPGDKLYKGEKEIGKITSTAFSPWLEKNIALGYVRREFAKDNEPIETTEHRTTAIVKTLPMSAS